MLYLAVLIKNTRHEKFALKELERIAEENEVSTDCVIRLAVYKFIDQYCRKSIKISEDVVEAAEFKARKACST